MSVKVLKPLVELCHLTTAPTLLPSVSTPLVLPLQIVAPPVTVPPTVVGLTSMVAGAEGRSLTLRTMALYCQIPADAGTVVYVVVVLAMSVQVPPLNWDCHLTIEPV